MKINVKDLIIPAYRPLLEDLIKNKHLHYILKGGRSSTKSSFISLYIILDIMLDENANALVLRNTQNTLKDSVFAQLRWAINVLNCAAYWKATVNPLKLIYTPGGNQILFRGADDPLKVRSVKTVKGYIKTVWYEELHEFGGMETIRDINQSALRGGPVFKVFYSYNPPKSKNSWVNAEAEIERPDRFISHTTYFDVPADWLGETFFIEAERLKKVNPKAYEHEYLGIATGIGGEVFDNIVKSEITDEQIKSFDRIRYGIDFGYAVDPFAFICCHYDITRKSLYIFDEVYRTNLSNTMAAEIIKPKIISGTNITADSAEPKSIAEMSQMGLKIKGAKKGPDSVEYGIRFLQSMEKIIIDPRRAPNAYKEFTGCEYKRDKNGNFISRYPDENNHTIDAARYAVEEFTNAIRAKVISKNAFGGVL
jgi:PBSX family phage terminase large subunit